MAELGERDIAFRAKSVYSGIGPMANLFTAPIQAAPNTIDVLVDFYDQHEQEIFSTSPVGRLLTDYPKTLSIPTPDFCAYYLYYKKRPGVTGYATHADLSRQWKTALVEFDGQIDFAESSIRLASPDGINSGTVERLGEAIGLCVASEIHGLHQADWARIPETTSRKTLDYTHPWSSSDGTTLIQLETKGSTAAYNGLKPTSVSNQKARIKAKKADAPDHEQRLSILYGTIGVLDARHDSVARCWLVDPPPSVSGSPERLRVLLRLHYIADLISLLAPRSAIAASLRTRLAALAALESIEPLDEVPLRKGNGEEFSYTTYARSLNHNPWCSGKSVVTDGPVGGRVYVADDSRLLFMGVREELLVIAAQQGHADIRAYRFPAAMISKTVECVLPAGRFDRDFARIMPQVPERSRTRGYVRFRIRGNLFYCQSGLVFGVLPIPEEWAGGH